LSWSSLRLNSTFMRWELGGVGEKHKKIRPKADFKGSTKLPTAGLQGLQYCQSVMLSMTLF
jgi:hypothetical protein